jgi:hypothetical protein
MPNWVIVTVSIINLVSIAGLVFMLRKVLENKRRHIHILGEANRFIVTNGGLRTFLFSYVVVIVLLAALSYYIFYL